MKKLVIIRHAKSAWDNPSLSDHERPLADRGLRDAPKMAQRLKERDIHPDLLMTSDAKRVLQTAEITAEAFKIRKEAILQTPTFYHASASVIFNSIKEAHQTIGTLFVFGHNPGLNDLVNRLGCDLDNLSTCGQVGFLFDVTDWKKITPKNARFWFLDYPKLEFPNI